MIAVLYPQTSKPYSRVFAQILTGIEDRLGMPHVRRQALAPGPDPIAVARWLEAESADAVITLGRVATQAYDATALALPQVIGALDISPQTHPNATGVSLSVDPSALFSTLELLAPAIERVFVVYNPRRERWIIDRAAMAAVHYDLKLLPFEATDLRAAAKHFWQILKTANPDTDALWLPMDGTIVDTEVVLPVVIEQSWQRRLIVFSSNLLHADLGVLFALYPDTEALGRRLADMALTLAKNPDARLGIEPLRDVRRALNLRIGSHLDLSITEQTRRQFDLIFEPRP